MTLLVVNIALLAERLLRQDFRRIIASGTSVFQHTDFFITLHASEFSWLRQYAAFAQQILRSVKESAI